MEKIGTLSIKFLPKPTGKKQGINTDNQELKQEESRDKQQDGLSKNLPSNHEQVLSFG